MPGREILKHRCRRTGKLKFLRKIDAEIALTQIDRSDGTHKEQRVYKCPFGKHWHLTSQPLGGNEDANTTST